MAGQPMELLTGGAGAYSQAPSVGAVAPSSSLAAGTGLQPHHGPVVLVLAAVALLVILDRAGFRFAVTAGRR